MDIGGVCSRYWGILTTLASANLKLTLRVRDLPKLRMNGIALLAFVIACCVSSLGQCGAYKNNWVKYADDRSTSYNIDTNSIMRNASGNYYVLVMMIPYKDNVFNKRLGRSDVAYVYSEQEIDITKNLIRVLSMRAFDDKGREVLKDSYAHTGELPPFEPIGRGSVSDALKNYVVNHRGKE